MNKYSMIRSFGMAAFAGAACSLCSCSKETGTYQGTCMNTTFGTSAPLVLQITSCSNGRIEGSLQIISSELEGGGSFTGTIQNGQLTFTTHGDGFLGSGITWTGYLSSGSITGTYCVAPTLLSDRQQGMWTARKK